jgi:hypothetical protein
LPDSAEIYETVLFKQYYIPALILSSAGLALLMLLGIIVRLKIKDELLAILPALLLMLINLKILFSI